MNEITDLGFVLKKHDANGEIIEILKCDWDNNCKLIQTRNNAYDDCNRLVRSAYKEANMNNYVRYFQIEYK